MVLNKVFGTENELPEAGNQIHLLGPSAPEVSTRHERFSVLLNVLCTRCLDRSYADQRNGVHTFDGLEYLSQCILIFFPWSHKI